MVTGYTAHIKKGVTFKQFALCCAKAFGACASLRDNNKIKFDEIPEIKPSTYHKERLTELREKLKWLDNLTEAEKEKIAKGLVGRAKKNWKRYENGKKRKRELYENMLNELSKWRPPSLNHIALKDFMEEQLVSTIQHDCEPRKFQYSYYYEEEITPEAWFERERMDVEYSIQRHLKEYYAEIHRARDNKKWIAKLKESLEGFD